MKVFSCIAHSIVFGLVKIEADSGYSKYELSMESLALGICEFPSHIAPKFSVSHDGSIAVYGGCSAYLVGEDHVMNGFEEQEEISRIWFLDDMLLVKCDTLLASRSRSGAEVINEYWHNEIIIFGKLIDAKTLIFQDLENGVFQMNIEDFRISSSNYPFTKLA